MVQGGHFNCTGDTCPHHDTCNSTFIQGNVGPLQLILFRITNVTLVTSSETHEFSLHPSPWICVDESVCQKDAQGDGQWSRVTTGDKIFGVHSRASIAFLHVHMDMRRGWGWGCTLTYTQREKERERETLCLPVHFDRPLTCKEVISCICICPFHYVASQPQVLMSGGEKVSSTLT